MEIMEIIIIFDYMSPTESKILRGLNWNNTVSWCSDRQKRSIFPIDLCVHFYFHD